MYIWQKTCRRRDPLQAEDLLCALVHLAEDLPRALHLEEDLRGALVRLAAGQPDKPEDLRDCGLARAPILSAHAL